MASRCLPSGKRPPQRGVCSGGRSTEKHCEHWKEVDDVRTKATNGDKEAMMRLSRWYLLGLNGLVIDVELSYSWRERALGPHAEWSDGST